MNKHTPAPWTCAKHSASADYGTCPYCRIEEAAPDLLLALQQIARVDWYPGVTLVELQAIARAAIAKATE